VVCRGGSRRVKLMILLTLDSDHVMTIGVGRIANRNGDGQERW